ncbi:helix-turn-helix domain-containing protein [Planococcus sp. CPCC 101016]|uniref:helix-turn-helix domain-containing protein n=1 Tax=Planococcus sp. CPCC 101016 TaxID=2599617 RepID=UPI0011B76C61|nr:helix-turn-helix domain-containing protein [Planococcus sp. CPCC 101016]TWT07323.1 helix-turn-helix domain-containing protein [Planococcus sp. CPCC 101016]
MFNTIFIESFNSKETKRNCYLNISSSFFSERIAAELKPTNLMVLLCLCSFAEKEGIISASQREIAKRSGLSKTTVNKAINELLEYRYKGTPIIFREFKGIQAVYILTRY